jgi:V8-like Glu-specific endopeptidase
MELKEATKKILRKLSLLLVFGLIVACGESYEPGLQGPQTPELAPVIIGELEWQEVSDFAEDSRVQELAAPVGEVQLPMMGSRCTGFLITKDIVMTNHHCIPTKAHAQGVKVSFNHLKDVARENHETYKCDEFIMNHRSLDYALLRCQGAPGDKFGTVQLNAMKAQKIKEVLVIQQNCDYYSDRSCDWTKKIAYGAKTRIQQWGNGATDIVHDADTLGGSSGSPVFDRETGHVIALHHAGRGNRGDGRGIENYAVLMKDIVENIEKRKPEVFGVKPAVKEPLRLEEKESNDSFSQAMKLAIPSIVTKATVEDADDEDFYQLTLRSRDQVSIKLNFSQVKGDLDMRLVDGYGKALKWAVSATDNEEIQVSSLSGQYYIVVYGFKGEKSPYHLEVLPKR